MKHLMLLMIGFSFLYGQAIAAETQVKRNNTYQVVKSETSFFSSLWSRIKRMVPRTHTTRNTTTAVIGVRGVETTESALQPYWEGDLTKNDHFRNDVKLFDDATRLCESSTPAKGSQTFEQLLKTTRNDMLKANAMIALASCYAKQGDEQKGRAQLQTFLDKYPKHPMSDEIQGWLTASH